MWTSMTAAVCGVSAAATVFGLSANVSGSMSANTGRAPARSAASAVAKNVLAGTMTSRPATSSPRRIISRDAVPLDTAIARGSWPPVPAGGQ